MFELTLTKGLILVATGLVAGLGGGMLGIGGSIIFLPVLATVFPEAGQGMGPFAATALVCNVFVGAGGAVGHYRNRRIIMKVVKGIIPLGIAAALVGTAVRILLEKQALGGPAIWVVLGLVVCYMIYRNIRKLFQKDQPSSLNADDKLALGRVTAGRLSGVALPTGFLSGMLAIGGGVYSVPSQQLILHMPQKNAIANSSATMPVFCAMAAVISLLKLPEPFVVWQPLALAACLVPTALIGSFIGGHLTHKLPGWLVRSLFIVFLFYAAYKCFVGKGQPLLAVVTGWIGL